MPRLVGPCDTCGGDTGVQGCAHEQRLDPSQISWRAACEYHNRILPPGRPPKKGPPGGWLSIEQIVENTDGLTATLFEEALHVRRHVVTHESDERWGILDRGEIVVGAVYDHARRNAVSANNAAGGKLRALTAVERRERDRRFTLDDIGDPYRAMVVEDFIDVSTERLADGSNPMRAPHILTVDDDGLTSDWGPKTRSAWCNKPFSLRAKFLARSLREAREGRKITYLETDDVSTFVAQTALTHATEIIACGGRPNYAKPDGTAERNTNFGTVLYGFGDEISSMLANGLRGVALIPTERVEQMLVAAIFAARRGASDEEAQRAAHAVPGVAVSDDIIDALWSYKSDRSSDDTERGKETADDEEAA